MKIIDEKHVGYSKANPLNSVAYASSGCCSSCSCSTCTCTCGVVAA